MRRPFVISALANTGHYALVPPIVVGLFLPSVLLLLRSGGAPQLVPAYVEKCMTLLIPALAAWWPPFVFKERIEGDGRELLYFLRPRGEGLTALSLCVVYTSLSVPFVMTALATMGGSLVSAVLLAFRCTFMISLSFCVAFVLRSSSLGLVLALLFNMTAMMPLEESVGLHVAVGAGSSAGAQGLAIAAYLLLSGALLVIGEFRGRHFAG